MQFEDLAGWRDEDFKAAFAAFRRSAPFLLAHPPTGRPGSATRQSLLYLAKKALEEAQEIHTDRARSFFENNFQPLTLSDTGFLTGYYEPVFEGSRFKSDTFCFPLHRRPSDLVPVKDDKARQHLSPETSFARQTKNGLTYHASRKEVYEGALDGMDLELVWLKDPVDAYIIHIQGSARINLADGGHMRVAFDGKSGYAYQSLGKLLIERGVFTNQTITMDKLTDFLRQQDDGGLALMAENPSYIFFKDPETDRNEKAASDKADFEPDPELGPMAAASIPLVPMRSVAVDRHCHTFGLPIWIETTLPEDDDSHSRESFRRLVFAHDTGSAIKGAARGDLFVGTGVKAGRLAGQIKQPATFTLLLPRDDLLGKEVL